MKHTLRFLINLNLTAFLSAALRTAGFFTLLAVPCLTISVSAQNWQLIWWDEFNYNGLPDSTKWGYDVGGGGWGNNELQYYTAADPDNARVENGTLIIEAREESLGGWDYTSARLVTRGKADWKYGRFVARAKMPTGQGLWPAIWLLPEDWLYGGWAASGEIDIMELVGNQPNQVYGTLHYGGEWPNNTSAGGDYTLSSGTFNDDFHVFEVEWQSGEFRWYVDGQEYYTRSSWWSSGGPFPAPFDQGFHLLLNVAVGGDWPGPPGPGTVFPQQMVIDYVRVYQNANAAPTVAITDPANGATLPAAAPFTISAVAEDSDGTIERVEFFQGDAKLGEDDSEPYELTIDNPAAGYYRLSAVASDDFLAATTSDTVSITIGGGAGQSPYLIEAAAIPGIVEVENYDIGGPGIAYQDSDPLVNNGSAFRSDEGVDIQPTQDIGLGYNVGWIESGEWLAYTVDIAAAGTYMIIARTAAEAAGGSFHLELDGQDVSGPISVPGTGGWQTWTSVFHEGIDLSAGIGELKIVFGEGGFNFNKFTLVATTGIGADDPAPLADKFVLHQNYPNPFNPTTVVAFRISAAAQVDLAIFNLAGQKIRTLVNGRRNAGQYAVDWDGRNAVGDPVGSGVYVYRLTVRETASHGTGGGHFQQARKMILLR